MGQVVYADPSEGPTGYFDTAPDADVIVITHKHGDHLKPANLTALSKPTTKIFAPATVAAMLTGMPVTTMANGEVKTAGSIEITAVAMYNTTPARLTNHAKGDGNSYVLKFGNKKVYVSGDTECTPELKALTGIDVAFLCMNLPYTMPVEDAAACTKLFAPKVVYPYHFRNGGGDLSDLGDFKTMVGASADVRIAKWYANQAL
jgi:L-ascorbate metabolism protein UlaG (beta-lactamase superfamily)